MVSAQTMRKRRQRTIAYVAVFVFVFVAEVCLGPKSGIVFAVIVESGVVVICVRRKREIEISKRAFPPSIHYGIHVRADVVILVTTEAVLPLRGSTQVQFGIR